MEQKQSLHHTHIDDPNYIQLQTQWAVTCNWIINFNEVTARDLEVILIRDRLLTRLLHWAKNSELSMHILYPKNNCQAHRRGTQKDDSTGFSPYTVENLPMKEEETVYWRVADHFVRRIQFQWCRFVFDCHTGKLLQLWSMVPLQVNQDRLEIRQSQ